MRGLTVSSFGVKISVLRTKKGLLFRAKLNFVDVANFFRENFRSPEKKEVILRVLEILAD